MKAERPELDSTRINRLIRAELTWLQVQELKRAGQDPLEYLTRMICRQEPNLPSMFPYYQVFYPDYGFAGTERGLGVIYYDLKG